MSLKKHSSTFLIFVFTLFSPVSKGDTAQRVFQTLDSKEQTATGEQQAQQAYALFQSGLPLYGVESLFRVKNPGALSPKIKKMWRDTLPTHHVLWPVVDVEWSQSWVHFFGGETQVRAQSLTLSKGKIRALLAQRKEKRAQAVLKLELALSLAAAGDNKRALGVLDDFLKFKDKGVEKGLAALTAGRITYSQGQWNKAAEYYNRVAQSSPYWFVAREELAWSYMVQGKPEKALAVTTSLIPDTFAAEVGAETIFLHAFSQLKTCHFVKTAQSIALFKERFKKKAQALMKWEKKRWSPSVLTSLQQLRGGEGRGKFPTHAGRDRVLNNQLQRLDILEKELAQVKTLLNAAPSPSISAVQKLKRRYRVLKSRSEKAQRTSLALIKNWAGQELGEIKNMLQKMHILEADWMQRIALAMVKSGVKVASAENSGKALEVASDEVQFPFTGEIWLDELNHYQLSSHEVCQK